MLILNLTKIESKEHYVGQSMEIFVWETANL